VIFGVALVIAGAMLGQVFHSPPPVYGQVPDSGAQRRELIALSKQTVERLDKIVGLLSQIRDQTRPASGDNDKGGASSSRGPG
jgi:hypothetical protein